MKPTERFSNRADDYRRYRPGYPAAVAALMREVCGLKAGAQVADIGAGTGIFTRVLLDAGFEVTAVEPNAAMRAAAEEELGGFPGFRSMAAPAEETGLPAAAFDAVTVAQGFHWFNQAAAQREFRRLLRPDGWVIIVRNHRREGTTPFGRDYEAMLTTLGDRYHTVGHRDEATRGRAIRDFFPADPPRIAQYDNPHVLDWTGLRGRFLSMSYVPKEGEPGHKDLLSRLEPIFNAHADNGHVTFDQVTEVYYGKLASAGDRADA